MMTSVRRLLICLPLLVVPLALGCRRSPALQSTQNQHQDVSEQDVLEQVEPADLAFPALPTRSDLPRSPSGAHYPLFLPNPDQLAPLLSGIELAIRNPDVSAEAIPSLAHQQQVIYRVLSHRSDLADQVRSKLDDRWRWVFDQHISARRSFLPCIVARLRPGFLLGVSRPRPLPFNCSRLIEVLQPLRGLIGRFWLL